MAKKSKFCPWCGAVMRPKAQFCHTCGKSLATTELAIGAEVKSSQTQELNAEVLATGNETMTIESQPAVHTAVIDEPPLNGSQTVIVDEPPTIVRQQEAALNNQSAAAPAASPKKKTRRAKSYASRTEYVWEQADAPNWSILLFSVLALVLVFVLLWLGNFWR